MKRMFFFMIMAIFIIAGCSMDYMGHESGDSGDDSADMTNFDPLLVKSNIAQGKSVTASSTEPGCPAENAVDGNTSTRWSSDFSDPQWISIDLGSSYSIDQVVLHWETAYGKEYKIQVSDDASTWTTIYHETNGNGGIDDLTVSGTGRYVRMYGIARSTQYGYSLWEFEINEEGSSSSSSGTNIAQGKSVTASSTEPGCPAENAVDGNTGTRWASDFGDPQWIYVALGNSYRLNRVVLNWETAYGKEYKIQVSDEGLVWTTIHHETNGNGGIDDISLSGTGRCVRMYGIARGTEWGYSLWEFEVYGEVGSSSSSGTNIAKEKPATASNIEGGNIPLYAVDGYMGTRWSSDFGDPQWIYVDLGSSYSINRVVLNWETAYGKEYKIQVSDDASTWTTIHHETNGNGSIDDLTVSGTGRYVRMYGIARGTEWGYSLWEFEIYGEGSASSSTSSSSSSKNIAGGPFLASSYEEGYPAINAIDRNPYTRWSSDFNDSEYIRIGFDDRYNDLCILNRVVLKWETAYAKEYKIQISDDLVHWTTLFHETNGNGGIDDIAVSGKGRYVKMYGIKRATEWGYSLFEFELYGEKPPISSSSSSSSNTMTAENLAQEKPVTASSIEAGNIPSHAVDGDHDTRWASDFSDPQWIYVDLQSSYNIKEVVLKWETAYAKEYKIQVSDNASTWTTIFHETNGDGGVDVIELSGTGRYVRMYGIARGTQWGYSLWEFEVYEVANVLKNPDFEDQGYWQTWTNSNCCYIRTTQSVAYSGEWSYGISFDCYDLSYTREDAHICQELSPVMNTGDTVVFTMYSRPDDDSWVDPGLTVELNYLDAQDNIIYSFPDYQIKFAKDKWKLHTITDTVPEGAVKIKVYCKSRRVRRYKVKGYFDNGRVSVIPQ